MRVDFGVHEEVGGFVVELVEVEGDEVGAVAVFEVAPKGFDGVEVGGVGRQPFEGESRDLLEETAEGGPLVHRAVVPDDDHLAAEMFEEVAEEGGDAGGVERAIDEGAEVEIAAKGFRRQGQRGDRGDPFAGSGKLAEDGTVPPRRPRPAAERRELETGLVDQNDVGVLGSPFLRIAGQSVCDQAAMWASSRWLARFAGFCGVKACWRSQRQK